MLGEDAAVAFNDDIKDVYELKGGVDKMRASGISAEEVAKYAYS